MNTQKPHLVIVIQSPDFISIIIKQIERFWTDYDIYFVTNPIFNFYKPLYPEPERVELPYIGNLSWKKNEKEISKVWQVRNQEVIETNRSSFNIIKTAETIVLMGCNTILIFPFEILLEQSFGKRIDKTCLVYDLEGFDEEQVEKTLKNPATRDYHYYQKYLARATAKKFFEYNFNFNSCILFKPVLQKAGITDNDFVLTKYVLQLLFELENYTNISEDNMLIMMEQWKGTGLYEQIQMGGPPSRPQMFKNLSEAGLIKNNKKGTSDNEHYDVSDKVKALLKLIHPDCRDIDLPGKINLWEDNWPDSKKEIEHYIVTFFKKQMDFKP